MTCEKGKVNTSQYNNMWTGEGGHITLVWVQSSGNWIELIDPISRIYPHDPPHEDRATKHNRALNCQMANVLQELSLPSTAEQIHQPKWLVMGGCREQVQLIPKSQKLVFQNTFFFKGMMKYWLKNHTPFVNSVQEHEQMHRNRWIWTDTLQAASLCWWQNSMLQHVTVAPKPEVILWMDNDDVVGWGPLRKSAQYNASLMLSREAKPNHTSDKTSKTMQKEEQYFCFYVSKQVCITFKPS